jgi:hypothetical protein
MHLTTLLLLLPAFLACSGKREAARIKAETPRPGLTPVVKYGGEERTDSLFFSLERTVCFGACKAYRIEVFRGGHATYDGRANVEKIGLFTGRVGRDTLDLLLEEAKRINFFDLQDRYDSEVTDLPSTIVRVVAMGRDKKVVGRTGYPEKFRAFVEYAEELLLPMPWKPVQPQH